MMRFAGNTGMHESVDSDVHDISFHNHSPSILSLVSLSLSAFFKLFI